MKQIEKWVNERVPGVMFREVHVKGHCHGVRVSLIDNHEDITSVVESTVEEAFNSAVSSYEVAKKRRDERKVERLTERIREGERDLRALKNEKKLLTGKK